MSGEPLLEPELPLEPLVPPPDVPLVPPSPLVPPLVPSFTQSATLTHGNAGGLGDVTSGDFTADGVPDLLISNWTDNTLSFFRGNGEGTYQSPTTVFGTSKPGGLMTGDFNDDDKLDVVALQFDFPNGGAWVLLGNGNGTFATPVYYTTGDQRSSDVAIADYDGDGKTDIAVFRPSNGHWYSLGSAGEISIRQWGIGNDIPTPGDYDGDGTADLSVFRPSTGSWYRLNSGNGEFFAVQYGTEGDAPVPAAYVPLQ